MVMIGFVGVVFAAITSTEALQRFKREREERFEEIVEW